jgi:hypothetical protein
MPKSGRKEGNFILACSSLFLFSGDGDKSQQKSRSYRNRCAVKTKYISSAFTAFTLSPNANTPDEACLDHGHRLEEDEQPSFLKGIDSLHDIGKSDDLLNSLVMIKECFFINKCRNDFIAANRAMDFWDDLAKDSLNEILRNEDEDNPKFILPPNANNLDHGHRLEEDKQPSF